MSYEAKLKEMGVEIPAPPKPAAAYIPGYLTKEGYVYVSGQLPVVNGELKYKGKVGSEVSEEDAYQAARLCAINALGVVKDLIGSLDKVERIVKVGGFVNCNSDYTNQPKIINGASEFLLEVFGEAGKHTRFAVGANGLPLGATVEVEMIVEVKK